MNRRRTCIAVFFLVVVMLGTLFSPTVAQAGVNNELNISSYYGYVGDCINLNVIGIKLDVMWSSKNESIATVSKEGKVRLRKPGKTVISASVERRVYKCRITVLRPTINKKTCTVCVNKRTILSVLGEQDKITWSSSNNEIAIVSQKGIVLGKKAGKCLIEAKAGEKTYRCNVTVQEPQVNSTPTLTISPTQIPMPKPTMIVTKGPTETPPQAPTPTIVPTQKPKTVITIEPIPTPPPTPTVTIVPTPEPLFCGTMDVKMTDSLTGEKNEYYGDYYNSTYVDDISQLVPIIDETLATRKNYNYCAFIYTKKGLLDEYSKTQESLSKKLFLCEDETKWMDYYYERGAYLFNVLGYDYQKMCGAGIDVILFNKQFDEGDYSIYSITGYADTTAVEYTKIQTKVASILPEINLGTDYDKMKNALDYLCNHVEYYDPGISRQQQSAYGALINELCVCEGYACAYKLLLDAMGVPCEIVSTKEHAWNIVELDGQWYLVDVTHCDENPTNYSKFLLGKDVLYATYDVKIDETDVIYQSTIEDYGYIDGSNQCQRELSKNSYNHIVN